MKVLFVSHSLPYTGGREVVLEHLLAHYSSGRHSAALISPDGKMRRAGIPRCGLNRPDGDLDSFVRKVRPDVVSCHTFYFAEQAIRIGKKFGIPVVLTLHGVFLDFYDRKYCDFLKRIIASADAVSVVSENYLKKLALFLGAPEKGKLRLIRNGIDIRTFAAGRISRAAMLKELGLPQGKRYVLSVTRFSRLKGLEYLVDAVGRMKGLEDVVFLVSTAPGRSRKDELSYKRDIMSKVKALGLGSRLKFRYHGYDSIWKLYRIADVFVLPSVIEGIAISILEAMASGVPVIAAKVGGNREIIENGKNGFLVPPRNGKALARAIARTLSEDGKKLDKVRMRAKDTVTKDFSDFEMYAEYDKLFSKTIREYSRKKTWKRR